MANVSAIDLNPTIVAVTTNNAAITLNPDRQYLLVHNGVDNAGSASTAVVYGSTVSSLTPGPTEGANAFAINEGGAVVIGPGKSYLALKTASGAATVTVAPGPGFSGSY